MSGKVLRKVTIQEMLEKRYTVEQISSITGIPVSTIYRHIEKTKREANHWFNQLATKDFIPEYKNIINSLESSIQQCYALIEEVDLKYDEMIKNTKDLMTEAENERERMHYKVELNNRITELEAERLKEKKDYVKIIQDFHIKKAQALHKAPMAWSIDQAIKKKSLMPEPTPQMPVLQVVQKQDDPPQ